MVIDGAIRGELTVLPHREERLADQKILVKFSESPVPADASKPQIIAASHTDRANGQVITQEHSHTGGEPNETAISIEDSVGKVYFFHRFNAPSIMEQPD